MSQYHKLKIVSFPCPGWISLLLVSALLAVSTWISVYIVAFNHKKIVELRIGTNIWLGYEPLYLAEELGYYPDRTVNLVEFLSASEVLRAFRNNAIEAAALTLDEALVLLDKKFPISIVLVMDISSGADVILAKPGIENFHDLAGKRVGVEGNALGAYVLSRALENNTLSADKIEIVHLEIDEHESGYLDGVVDAIVTFEPVKTRLLAARAKEIFSSREIPGEIVDVLVIHRDCLNSHHDQVESIIEAWFQALDYISENPVKTVAQMSSRLDL